MTEQEAIQRYKEADRERETAIKEGKHAKAYNLLIEICTLAEMLDYETIKHLNKKQ